MQPGLGQRTPYIHGLRVGGFRTLKDVEFRASGPVTVVCGPNNSGKSSILDAIEAFGHWWVGGGARSSDDVTSNREQLIQHGLHIGVDLLAEAVLEYLCVDSGDEARARAAADWLANNLETTDGLWWVPLATRGNNYQQLIPHDECLQIVDRLLSRPQSRQGEQAQRQIRKRGSPWLPQLLDAVTPRNLDICRVPDVRRAGTKTLHASELEKLAIAGSSRTEDPSRKVQMWAQILEDILRDVFGSDTRFAIGPKGGGEYDFRLSLHGQHEIPLEDVGAGVREVVAIGYHALSSGGAKILIVEEPENCLHPTAARRLVNAVATRTGAQLIISTHSAAVINAGVSDIIEVERRGAVSTTRTITRTSERFEAVTSLGYLPADLVLTPCAVWVEGPSDRLYLNRWLQDYNLTEGEDYSVMFFGGALGAHLSIDPDHAQDLLVDLGALCRRCALIADSDRDTEDTELKSHVRRWIEEARGEAHVKVFVTPGREIENCSAVGAVNKVRAQFELPPLTSLSDRYERVIPRGSGSPRISKVDFAERVLAIDLSPGQIAREWVGQIASFIQSAPSK